MTGFLFSYAPSWLLVGLAGVWPMIGTFGTGTAILAGLLAAAWFSPVFKKEFLWGAAGVGGGLFLLATGVAIGEKRVRAQWQASVEATIKQGEKARTRAVRDVARRPAGGVRPTDRFDRDRP